MRKLFFTILILFTCSIIYSQNIEYKYYNWKWKSKSEKRAKFIRKIEKLSDTLYKVTDYDKHDNVYMKGEYSSINPMIENGHFDFYDYFNFSKVVTGQYSNGQMTGEWIFKDYDSNFSGKIDYNLKLIETENYGETKNESDSSSKIVGIMPKFKNDDFQSFSTYVGRNLVYPPMAQKYIIQGTVFLQFDIDKYGQVCDIKVMKKINKDLEREAIRVISQSSDWSPGIQKGEPVKVRFTFPVVFDLK